MEIATYISIITLNVNGLNAPTKRHRLAKWIQKQDPYICSLPETHFRPKDTYKLKVRGWKNIFHANGKQNKPGIAILISDKIDLKIKKITRDKEGHYTMIKGSILGHDSSLSKFKKIEILSSIFNNHNAMRLDINYKKKLVRSTNTWRLNIMFLKNQQVTEEIKKEIKKISRNK